MAFLSKVQHDCNCDSRFRVNIRTNTSETSYTYLKPSKYDFSAAEVVSYDICGAQVVIYDIYEVEL